MTIFRRFASFVPALAIATALVGAGLSSYSHIAPPPKVSEGHPQRESQWSRSLMAASAEARAQNKSVIILFSRDASASAPLLKEIAAFAPSACFVRLDPQTGPGQGAVTTTLWAQRLSVTRLPQVVLVDADGRGCARILLENERELSAGQVEALLTIRTKRDQSLAEGETVAGPQKARALDRALETVADFRGEYLPQLRELVALDADNTLGLRRKYLPDLAARELDLIIQEQVYPLIDQGSFSAAAARVDALITQWGPDSRQLDMLFAFKGQILYSMGDPKGAMGALDTALTHAPQGSETAEKVQTARSQILAANTPPQPVQ